MDDKEFLLFSKYLLFPKYELKLMALLPEYEVDIKLKDVKNGQV